MPNKNYRDDDHHKRELTPELALPALKKQLADLQKLKGLRFDEADLDETEWENLTQSIIEATFRKDSSNMSKFHRARNAGYHNLMGITPQQQQNNFVERTAQCEALLKSLIAELNLFLPQAEMKGAYEAGEEYDFYRDLSSLIALAESDILIVDAYIDDRMFDLYLSKVPAGANVRILSSKISGNTEAVARMYAAGKRLLLRTSKEIHDRSLFVDGRVWVIGQSLKDAARTKPTYIIETQEPLVSSIRNTYEALWSSARVIV